MSLPKIDILIDLFVDFTSCKIQENFQEVIIENKFKSIIVPSSTDFINALNCLNSRDKLQLSIIFDGGESVDYYSESNAEAFLKEITNSMEIKDVDSDILVSFKILKALKDGVVSSYFNDDLIDGILSMDFKGALYTFHQCFNIQKFLIVESQYQEINVKTPTICITSNISQFSFSELSYRQNKISKLKSVAFFSIINQYDFLPEDFHIQESTSEKATRLFDKLCEAFSIGYLFDETTVESSITRCKLNGFKSFALQFEFKTLIPGSGQYFKIYDWCYNEGNFVDKIGLSRNIISLHIEAIPGIKLKGDAFQSLLSNYRIYEKQNIKQYIEIRNKISEQLLSFNDRANKIVETFASGFQKNALVLVSFYISAIAIKLLGKGEFVNLFTLDATVLAVGFIVCSFIYFFFSSWEVRVQRQRFIDSYINLKSRYLDLLEESDINRILNNDKEYVADLKFITDKKRNYGIMWLLFLGILLAITLFLFFTYNLTQLFDTRLWHIIFSKNDCTK